MSREWEKKRLDEAEIVENFEGPVYDPHSERGYDSLSEFCDEWEGDPHLPEFVFCCEFKPVEICVYDLEDTIISQLPEEHDGSDPPGWEEFVKAVEAFNALQVAEKSGGWWPDWTRKVRVKSAELTK